MRILEYAEFNNEFPSVDDIRECFDDLTDEVNESRILRIKLVPEDASGGDAGCPVDHLSKSYIRVAISLGYNKKWKSYQDVIDFLGGRSGEKIVSKKYVDDHLGDGSHDKIVKNLKNAEYESNPEIMKIVDILKNCIERIEDSYNLIPINFIWIQPYTDDRREYIYWGYFFKDINAKEKSKLEKHFKEYIIDNHTYNEEPKNPIEGIFDLST